MKRIMMVIGAGVIALFMGLGLIFGYRFMRHRGQVSHGITHTLAIIKPDAVQAKMTGRIIDAIEQKGFVVANIKKVHLEREQAARFYAEHAGKRFFDDLVTFMSSGPIVVMILEKENAVKDWRDLMGATDPAKAEVGTMRKEFGTSKERNAVHGSDSPAAAHREIKFFFAEYVG